jgi:phage terminase large subunit-like protein
MTNSEKKEARAGRLLNLYQLIPTRVMHAEPLPALEEQMVAFPKAPNDDLVDSVGNAVLRFLKPPSKPRAAVRSVSPR